MTDPLGFLRHPRQDPDLRPVADRVRDWEPAHRRPTTGDVERQASRCMDCGVPFCHAGCPLGNLIPEWNDLVSRSDWREASERLHATNNFPEFTGWLCPAPCEDACVVTLADAPPVAIKQVELAIADRAWDAGWVRPRPARARTGRSVAVVGSGPAGLAAAQQLTRAGHRVVVLERSELPGGMLRYGIPDFKMPKRVLDRRLRQLVSEGTTFRTGVTVGRDPSLRDLREAYDAVVLAGGALRPREVRVPGRHLGGVWQAMDYLAASSRAVRARRESPVSAAGCRVVIVGGGDTAADCLGTAHRQGAGSVVQVDHNPVPPDRRDPVANPWPQAARVRPHPAVHEEGLAETWGTEVTGLTGDASGHVTTVHVRRVALVRTPTGRRFDPVAGSGSAIPADLVLLAAGFVGPDGTGALVGAGVGIDPARGTLRIDDAWRTELPGVFACGDATRGASLVVWAIADGRACAAAVDAALGGHSDLPVPVAPGARPL